jgi:hypothetical protein
MEETAFYIVFLYEEFHSGCLSLKNIVLGEDLIDFLSAKVDYGCDYGCILLVEELG